MFKHKYDIYFAFCILFMTAISIYIGFKYLQQKSLDEYLSLIHDKISSMISDEETKEEFENFFNDFAENVGEKSINADVVEELANNVAEMQKTKKVLTKENITNLFSKIRPDSISKSYFFELNDENFHSKDWQMLAMKFTKACSIGDSIRNLRKKSDILYQHLNEKLKIHNRLTIALKEKSLRIKQKFNEIKEKDIDAHLEKILLKQIETLRRENIVLNNKISDLNEMQGVICNEKGKLQDQLAHIDSLQSGKL